MASQAEKEKLRRAEIERAYVAEPDPVGWRDALVADRPSVIAERIIIAALDAGWSVQEKYRETFLAPQWVAVEGEAHVYQAPLVKVYDLYVHLADLDAKRLRAKGVHVLTGVTVLWIDGTAKRAGLGYADKSVWTPGPSINSIAKLIREARP